MASLSNPVFLKSGGSLWLRTRMKRFDNSDVGGSSGIWIGHHRHAVPPRVVLILWTAAVSRVVLVCRPQNDDETSLWPTNVCNDSFTISKCMARKCCSDRTAAAIPTPKLHDERKKKLKFFANIFLGSSGARPTTAISLPFCQIKS